MKHLTPTLFTSRTPFALCVCLILSACAHRIDLTSVERRHGPLADFEELVAQQPPVIDRQKTQLTSTNTAAPSPQHPQNNGGTK